MNAWRAAANRYGQGRMSQQDLEDVMRVRLLSWRSSTYELAKSQTPALAPLHAFGLLAWDFSASIAAGFSTCQVPSLERQ